MPATHAAVSICQQHSPDGWVRLGPGALASIVLEHVCTVQDLSLLEGAPTGGTAAADAGLTEWQSQVNGRLVSMGWDWLRLHDGALVPDTRAAPRTNLMPLDARGYDTAGADQVAALWRLIATTPWQGAAAGALAATD